MTEQQLRDELDRSQKQIQVLHQRLSLLEQTGPRKLPETLLLSDNFLKRAFTVLGHNMVASLIIMVPFYLLMFLLFLAMGVSFM